VSGCLQHGLVKMRSVAMAVVAMIQGLFMGPGVDAFAYTMSTDAVSTDGLSSDGSSDGLVISSDGSIIYGAIGPDYVCEPRGFDCESCTALNYPSPIDEGSESGCVWCASSSSCMTEETWLVEAEMCDDIATTAAQCETEVTIDFYCSRLHVAYSGSARDTFDVSLDQDGLIDGRPLYTNGMFSVYYSDGMYMLTEGEDRPDPSVYNGVFAYSPNTDVSPGESVSDTWVDVSTDSALDDFIIECADITIIEPTRDPSEPLSCTELGWGLSSAMYETRGYFSCAASSVDNICFPWMDHGDAVDFCSGLGARLCNYEEMLNDIGRGTGCKYDEQRVWTSDECRTTENGAYTIAGASEWAEEFPPECTKTDLTLPFRCCADQLEESMEEDIPEPMTCKELGWPVGNGFPTVCSKSRINGYCAESVPYDAAHTICASVGARLCTAPELTYNEAKETGCTLDEARVWSSTECDTYPDGRVSQAGAGKFLDDIAPTCMRSEDGEASGHEAGVRCCADVGEKELLKQTDRFMQVMSCSELGWEDTYGDSNVCAESKIFGVCFSSVSWEKADQLCTASGARLCTADEVKAEETKETGCKFDDARIWSSDVCTGGYVSLAGAAESLGTFPVECSGDANADTVAAVRCCADVDQAVDSRR